MLVDVFIVIPARAMGFNLPTFYSLIWRFWTTHPATNFQRMQSQAEDPKGDDGTPHPFFAHLSQQVYGHYNRDRINPKWTNFLRSREVQAVAGIVAARAFMAAEAGIRESAVVVRDSVHGDARPAFREFWKCYDQLPMASVIEPAIRGSELAMNPSNMNLGDAGK